MQIIHEADRLRFSLFIPLHQERNKENETRERSLDLLCSRRGGLVLNKQYLLLFIIAIFAFACYNRFRGTKNGKNY